MNISNPKEQHREKGNGPEQHVLQKQDLPLPLCQSYSSVQKYNNHYQNPETICEDTRQHTLQRCESEKLITQEEK